MKILIADDHEMVRAGLIARLGQIFPEATVFEASGFGSFRAIRQEHQDIDLAIVDLKMPDGDWRTELRDARTSHSTMRILVLSGLESASVVRQVLPELADGFIPKSADARTLVHAVQMVLDGGTYVPMVALSAADPGDDEADFQEAGALTTRQREVLRLIAAGKANKQIAYELGLSIGTVKIHVSNILSALGASNRTEAIVIARQRFGTEETSDGT